MTYKWLHILLCLTLLQPVQASQPLNANDHKLFNQLVKETAINTKKPITIYELWGQMYPLLTREERAHWYAFLSPHFEKRLPSMRVAANKVFYNTKQDSLTLEFLSDPNLAYKINGQKMSYKSLSYDGGRSHITRKTFKGPKGQALELKWAFEGKMLPIKWVLSAHPKTQKKYFTAMREYLHALEEAQRSLAKTTRNSQQPPSRKHQSLWAQWLEFMLLPDRAFASGCNNEFVGTPCVDAGWISEYRYKNASCQATCDYKLNPTANSFARPGHVPCNPAIFGSSSDSGFTAAVSGRAFYIPTSTNRSNATHECHLKSPVDQYLASLKEISEGDQQALTKKIAEYNERLTNAIGICATEPASKDPTQETKEGAPQDSACAALRQRYLEWREASDNVVAEMPTTPPPIQQDPPKANDTELPDDTAEADPDTSPTWWEQAKSKTSDFFGRIKDNYKNNTQTWHIAAGVVAFAGLFALWRSRKKKKSSEPTPVVTTPEVPAPPVLPPIVVADVDRQELSIDSLLLPLRRSSPFINRSAE